MAVTTPISFSGRDYTAETERLRQRAIEILTEWTDHNYSDPGEMIIALQGTTTDLINATIDNYCQENFLDARFRQSLIDQGKKVGYYPNLAAAATTKLRFTRLSGVTGVVTIPQYSAFARSDGVEYLTTQTVIIPADSTYVDADALQGILITQTINSANFIQNDWTQRPKFNLGTNVAGRTLTLTSNNGANSWQAIETFFRVQPTDMVFLLELNGDDDTVWLVLGNGIRGQGPTTDAMTLQFVRTAGALGNCGTGVISIVPDELTALITCANIEPATGGASSETRESLRETLPDRTSRQRRGVTKTDYRGLVQDVPGVLHCQALDRNDSDYWPHNYKILYVVPNGGGPMSSLLRTQILQECCAKGCEGNWPGRYVLRDAIEVPVIFSIRAGLVAGYDAATVTAALNTALATFMDPTNQQIGGTILFGTIFNLINAVPGIAWAEFISPTQNIILTDGEFPTFGGLTVAYS